MTDQGINPRGAEWIYGLGEEPPHVTYYLDESSWGRALRDALSMGLLAHLPKLGSQSYATLAVNPGYNRTSQAMGIPTLTIHYTMKYQSSSDLDQAVTPLLLWWKEKDAVIEQGLGRKTGMRIQVRPASSPLSRDKFLLDLPLVPGIDTPEVVDFIFAHSILRESIPVALDIMGDCFPDDRFELVYDDGVDASGESPDSPHLRLLAWTHHSPHYAMKRLASADDRLLNHPIWGAHGTWQDMRKVLHMDVAFEAGADPEATPPVQDAGTYYSGSAWLRQVDPNKPMSAFGERVADMLGQWYRGIYHNMDVRLADWSSDHHVEIRHYGSLSTYDNADLTRLVLLAHRDAIRVEIRARNHQYMTILFHPRTADMPFGDRRIYEWHPGIEDAIDIFNREPR